MQLDNKIVSVWPRVFLERNVRKVPKLPTIYILKKNSHSQVSLALKVTYKLPFIINFSLETTAGGEVKREREIYRKIRSPKDSIVRGSFSITVA